MGEPNPIGRPPNEPTAEITQKMGESVRQYMAVGLCASALRIHPIVASRWMQQGEQDILDKKWTSYAEFCLTVRENQAEKGKEILTKVSTCPKNWQALTWMLQNCLREEFGSEAKEYKELLEAFKKLMEDVGRLKQSSQGVVNNG